MSYSSEDETDISDSEMEEYVDRCYEQLKVETQKLKFSDTLYRCPYCPGKKKIVYPFKDILQHASDVAKGSQNKDIKHKGKHLGLVKYLKSEVDHEDLSSKLTALTLVDQQEGNGVKDLFVWPWMGIVANFESVSKLKDVLAKRGVDAVRVRQLSSGSKYAVVEFKKDWSGFYGAIMFEKGFEVVNHGRKDYYSPNLSDELLYGWVARDGDYNSDGILGDFLRKNGDLKTVGDLENEEKRKNGLLVADLSNTIQELRMRLEKNNNYHEQD
ncbi:hypothetical protein ABFX02_04G180800 [Erythranthe guttata]